MSTYTSEPGTRLAGRYRLEDQTVAGNGWVLWKAIDETLARPVSVLTFAPGFPRIAQVVTAARAASRLTDPRLSQVFDVEDGEQAYIVLEWVGGESLTELLADGQLDTAQACSLMCDAARAIAGAHALGQAHLRLTPDTLRWSRGSGIKITGLGIDAALAGDGLTAGAEDPAIADTFGLAALSYAALTGYWPGEEPTSLPAAPTSDGMVCTPRQVSADVPAALDGVITRALLQRPTRQGPPIQTPAEFADELTAVAPPVPLPEPAPLATVNYYGPDPDNPDTWSVDGRGPSGTAPYRAPQSAAFPGTQYPANGFQGRRQRGGANRTLATVVAVVVVAVIGVVVWLVGFNKSGSSGGTAQASQSASGPAPVAGTLLRPASDQTFNILGSDSEDAPDAQDAIDASPGTFWHTDTYQPPANFGNLKSGTGLLIDMGKPVRLSQVQVMVGQVCCTTAEIYLGNSDAKSKSALQNFTLVGQRSKGEGTLTYKISSAATGRYVLIWLTGDLPPSQDHPGSFQGRIYNVAIRGSAASGNS